jgi:hypothetical protein
MNEFKNVISSYEDYDLSGMEIEITGNGILKMNERCFFPGTKPDCKK